MNVASLELCRELEQLRGWTGTHWVWRENLAAALSKLLTRSEMEYDDMRFAANRPEHVRFREENRFYSAYDLGYLMRNLPYGFTILTRFNEGWLASWAERADDPDIAVEADTPEDAAAKLAIELFKQGIPKQGQS